MAKKKNPISKYLKENTDVEDDRTFDDARNVYIYDDEKKWSCKQLAKEFKGVKDCRLGTLMKWCAEEEWVEQRKRYKHSVERKTFEKFVDNASSKKSEQAVRNINRIEILISLLMTRFSNAGKLLIKSDYDAARLLSHLIQAQSEIYESVDTATMSGVKGHRFIIRMEHDKNDPLDLGTS